MASRFEKFSERARRVLSLAQEEAQRFNHNYIGTEHILLGLVRETDGTAAKVLASLAIELGKVRSAVEFIIGKGETTSGGEIGLTPRSKKVIELAVDESRRLNLWRCKSIFILSIILSPFHNLNMEEFGM